MRVLNFIFLYLIAGYTMTYGNMPLIIPFLATGYLLTVYLLLVLAERNAKEAGSSVVSASKTLHEQETPITGKVREVSSVR